MDLITLALAKKYTDEQVGSGGGGTAEIPYFDFTEMGMPPIDMAFSTSSHIDGIFPEFEEAIKRGVVRIRFSITADDMLMHITGFFAAIHTELEGFGGIYTMSAVIGDEPTMLVEVLYDTLNEPGIQATYRALNP